jgi:putative salt-induced outer membrane protein YdiY
MPCSRHAGFAAVLGLFFALRCLAAEDPALLQRLELPDGEILIGSVVNDDETTYVFRSQSLGELRVKKDGVHLSPVTHAGAETADQSPAWAKAKTAPSGPTVATAPATTPPSGQKAVAAAPPPVKWKRALEAGYSYQARGNLVNNTSTYVRAEVMREWQAGSIGLMARYLFGEQNGQHNTDKFDADLKIHYDYADRVVFRNDFTYAYDRLKQLSNQFEEDAGLNLLLANGRRFRYSIGPGVAIQYTETTDNQNGYKVLGDFSQEFSWQICERVKLTNTASYLYKPANWADYRLRVDSALIGKVSEHATMSVRYEYEFEALRPLEEGRSDNRVFTTLGYTF